MMRALHHKGILFLTLVVMLVSFGVYTNTNTAQAQPNLHINYQGKLTDSSGVAVPDGDYNLRFFLYDTAGVATTSAIWHESLGNASSTAVTITNGLFSVMLGSTSPLTSVDFNQTLYLGVEIGSSTPTPTWDGEMSPRKTLGTVPAAFEARQLDGLATTSFLRADQADTMEATESSTLLSLIQNGTGAIFDAINASAASVFKIFESGIVTIGTSTETGIATSTGLAVYNKDVEVLVGGPALVGYNSDTVATLVLDIVGDYAYLGSGSAGTDLKIYDVSDKTNPTLVGETQAASQIRGLQVVGNYAYTGSHETGDDFEIYDVSDKTNPTLVSGSGVNLDATVRTLDISGKYVFIGTEATGDDIYIFDVSNPTAPVKLWSIDTAIDGVHALSVQDNYLYVGLGPAADTIQIYDISDPTSPILRYSADLGTWVRDIKFSGHYAYVASVTSTDNFNIYDLSDPVLPVLVESVSVDSDVYTIDLVGNYAYIGKNNTGTDEFEVYNISSSTNVYKVAGIDVGAVVFDVEVHGNYAYLGTNAALGRTLEIYDLAGLITPTANIGNLVSNQIETDYLRVTQALTTDGSLNVGGNAKIDGALTITGTASSSLQSGNTNPALTITSGYVGIGTTTPYADLSVAGDVALTGGLYDSTASLGANGMVLQSTGSGVQWVATSTYGGGNGLFTDGGDITYLTSLTDVLSIGTSTDIATSTGLAVYNRDIELFQGTDFEMIGTASFISDSPEGIVIVGDYAYVVGWDTTADEFAIVDISDPTSPSVTGGYSIDAQLIGLDVQGNYAYVVGVGGMAIFDISDKTNPLLTAVLTSGLDQVHEIKVSGNYAYLGNSNFSGNDEFIILNVADPTNPYIVQSVALGNGGGYYPAVEIYGRYAFLGGPCCTYDEFIVLDVSDPTNVVLTGSADANEIIFDIVISGHYAYTLTQGGSPRLDIFDISDPTTPVEVSPNWVFGGLPTHAEIVNDYLFVSTENYGGGAEMYVIDVSDPTAPVNLTSIEIGADVYDFEIHAGKLFVTTYVTGETLQVYDLPSLVTPTANIGNLLSDDITTAYLTVTQALKADSLNINTNGMIGGSLTITGTASSSLIASNTNTALTITSGYIQMGTSTNATSGIQIGYGAICVDNDGACTASTTGRISSVSTYSGNSDLAETYFSSQPLEAGDIVALDGELSVQQANRATNNTIIGVVSTKPGVLLGFDDISTRAGETAYPIALKGRIPVKVSTENGPINPGDQLMLSSIPGTAMKATGTGATIGIALEAFNPTDHDQYYSDTFINQYIDDLPSTEDAASITEQLKASSTNRIALGTTTRDRADDTEVQQGQIVMFVDLSYRYLDTNTSNQLASLMSAAPKQDQGTNEDETLFDRITTLAKSFVDGVLSITRLKVDKAKVQVVCVDSSVCLDSSQLQELLNRVGTINTPITTVVTSTTTPSTSTETGSSTQDSTTPQTPTTTTESGENTTTASTTISDNSTTASTTTGGDLVNTQTASSSEDTEVEPQNDDVQQTEVAETPVADEDPPADETPVSDEVETDTAPVPEEPEPEVVEEVEVPEPVNQATS